MGGAQLNNGHGELFANAHILLFHFLCSVVSIVVGSGMVPLACSMCAMNIQTDSDKTNTDANLEELWLRLFDVHFTFARLCMGS